MITQEKIDQAVNGIQALTGEDEPENVFIVMDFDGFVATIGAVGEGEEESADLLACKTLLSSMSNDELDIVQEEVASLREETT